jgi:hypothetical protein
MTERTKARKAIVSYMLTALDLSDNSIKTLTDTLRYDAPSKLLNMRQASIDQFIKDGRIFQAEGDQLMRLQVWVAQYKEDGNGIPDTLPDWESVFSADIFDHFVEAAFIAPKEAETAAAIDESTTRASTRGIKPSDYPDFNGRGEGWFVWRLEYEATAEMAGSSDVLSITDSAEHLAKRIDDSRYNDRVKYQYSMLKKKTSHGIALAKVKKYEKTKDGAFAWRDLKEYYNQEGNKKTYGVECLKSLLALTLTDTSNKGMDDYIGRFDMLNDQLAESNQPITDDQKKVFFLRGITDQKYMTTRDLCQQATVTYMSAALLMKQKSTDLMKSHNVPGVGSFHVPYTQGRHGRRFPTSSEVAARKHNFTNAKGGGPPNSKSQSQSSPNNNKVDRLPADVWGAMSKDNQVLWQKMKLQRQGKTEFGQQYGNSNTRKANSKTLITSAKAPEDPGIKEIEKPVSNGKVNNTAKAPMT